MGARMTHFDIKILREEDGTWAAFEADWKQQCEDVGESIDDYSPEALELLRRIAMGKEPSLGGTNESAVGALWDNESKRYWAAMVLNRVMLPKTPGYTLRVRHMTVSPAVDYGVAEVRMYPDIIIGLVLGIVYLSSTAMHANTLQMHLRSPQDVEFFRVFAASIGPKNVFASVQIRGAWLYIEKVGVVGTTATEETE